MMRRSRAREIALQMLVQRDLNPLAKRAALEQFVRGRVPDPAMAQFTLGLVDGVAHNAQAIDQRLAAAADNWRVARMAVVDRNVLRLAAFELLFTPDIPQAVAINEAIELARRFGSADSPGFVNGVIDRIRLSAIIPA